MFDSIINAGLTPGARHPFSITSKFDKWADGGIPLDIIHPWLFQVVALRMTEVLGITSRVRAVSCLFDSAVVLLSVSWQTAQRLRIMGSVVLLPLPSVIVHHVEPVVVKLAIESEAIIP